MGNMFMMLLGMTLISLCLLGLLFTSNNKISSREISSYTKKIRTLCFLGLSAGGVIILIGLILWVLKAAHNSSL